MKCDECEAFLDIDFDELSVFLWLPLTHTHAKVEALVGPSRWQVQALDGEVIRVDLSRGALHSFLIQLKGALTNQELKGSRAVTLPLGEEPCYKNLHRVLQLDTLVGLSYGDWVRRMLETKRYTTHFQPIICAKTGAIRAYEALFRGRDEDGSVLSPGHIFSTAAGANMQFQLDLAARRSAVELASRLGIGKTRLFINFNPTAV